MGRRKGSKNKRKFYQYKEKVKDLFTEFANFFSNENEMESAMKDMVESFKSLKPTEFNLFQRRMRYNAKYSYLEQLSELLTMCFFNCKNVHQFHIAQIRKNIDGCGKSTLNNFLNNDNIDWRYVCDVIFKKVREKVEIIDRQEEREEEEARSLRGESLPSEQDRLYTTGIIDDTDHKLFGKKFELGGKIFSHTEQKMIQGQKVLFFTINDGKISTIKDFAIVGEKGKNGNHGMTEEELAERLSKEREEGCAVEKRIEEHETSKMDLAKDMIQRAVDQGYHMDYILCDSWFGCPSFALFVLGLETGTHFLGMTKKNKTKYIIKNGEEEERLCATDLIEKFKKSERKQYDRSLKYHHIDVNAFILDKDNKQVPIKIFFVRGGKRSGYSVILTTDTSLDFKEVIKIYGYRWSIEVTIRDLKQHLCLTKCQIRNFTGNVAHVSICIIRYNLLAMMMRKGHYHTIGGLFRDIQGDCMELTVIQKFRILFWEMIDVLQNFVDSDDVIEDFLLALGSVNSKFKIIADYKYRASNIS